MNRLNVGFMRDIVNIEFVDLYKDIIKEMEKVKSIDPLIQPSFEKIKPHLAYFNDALRRRMRNPHAIKNIELTSTRNEYLISLRRRVSSYLLSQLPQDRVAAKCINCVLERYNKSFFVPSIKTQGVLVCELFQYMEEREDFKESFTILWLNDLMDAIADITKEIEKNYIQCSRDNMRRKEKNDGVREAAYRDMKTMINSINYTYENCQNDKEKKEDMDMLMKRINDSFKIYRTPLKGRATKRRNKRTKNAANELLDMQEKQNNTLPVGENRIDENGSSVSLSEGLSVNNKNDLMGDKSEDEKLPPTDFNG